jgi:hypothetical protein
MVYMVCLEMMVGSDTLRMVLRTMTHQPPTVRESRDAISRRRTWLSPCGSKGIATNTGNNASGQQDGTGRSTEDVSECEYCMHQLNARPLLY